MTFSEAARRFSYEMRRNGWAYTVDSQSRYLFGATAAGWMRGEEFLSDDEAIKAIEGLVGC